MKIVRVALSPPDAVVTIKGERLEHPSGFVDLPGPVGYVFELQVAANGSRVAKRVEVTANGADPAAIAIASPVDPSLTPETDPVAADLLRAATQQLEHPADRTTARVDAAAATDGKKGAVGAIMISAYPWATVTEGSRQICTTPCSGVALPVGVHALVLTNKEAGLTRKVSITVRPGETTALVVALADGRPRVIAPTPY